MTITFLNVEQGDTIVVEWIDEGNRKIALIDCNKLSDGGNPAIEYIQKSGLNEIEYLILSHPHYDHFSGFESLLNYCENHSISIRFFLHTSQLHPDFLKMAFRTSKAEKELQELFKTLRKLRPKVVKEICCLQANAPKYSSRIQLNNDIHLEILAPSFEEKDKFIRSVALFNEEEVHNDPKANWLSTILKIEGDDWYILLTSDSPLNTFRKIGVQRKNDLYNTTLN